MGDAVVCIAGTAGYAVPRAVTEKDTLNGTIAAVSYTHLDVYKRQG